MRAPSPSTRRAPDRLALAAVVVVVVVWGSGAPAGKLTDAPGLVLVFWRLWLAVPLMLAAAAISRRPVTLATLRRALPGGALFGLHLVLFFSALRETSVAVVTVVSALQPALVLLVAGPLFGERASTRQVALTLVAVGGVVGVVLGSDTGAAASPLGLLLAGANVVGFTAYFLVSKRTRTTLGGLEYFAAATLVAALVVSPVALLSGAPLGQLTGTDWLGAGFIVVTGGIGHTLINWAHRYVDVSISSLAMLGVPVLSALAAWVVLDEAVTTTQAVCGVVVVAALAAVLAPTRSPALAAERLAVTP